MEDVKRASDKVIEEIKDQWKDTEDTYQEWYSRAVEAYRFYTGLQQWDPGVIAQLAAEGRPYLTINKVFPLINVLWGYQSQNRDDITLYPRRGGVAPVAELGSELIRHTLDISEGFDEISDMFGDGLIGGIGWVGIEQNYLEDIINGDIYVEKKSPFNMRCDPNNNKYNINKGSYVFEDFWWSQEQAELQWPKKARDLKAATEAPEYQDDSYYFGIEKDTDEYTQRPFAPDKMQYKFKDRWYKKWEMCTWLIHIPSLTKQLLTGDKLKQIRESGIMSKLAGEYQIIERPAQILYRSISCGELLLEHVRDPLEGVCLFPHVRFCPYFIDGYIMGLVDNIKQPQEELNKRRSQALHTLNTTAHSGYKVKSAQDAAALDDLKRNGSKPGYVVDKSKFGGEVEETMPKPMDIAHIQFSEMSAQDMQDITGINPALLETSPEPKESGRAKMLRQRAGLMVSQKIFDNFGRTETELGFLLWEVIRNSDVYSPEEVEAIVQTENLQQFMTQDPMTGQPKIDLSPLKSMKFGRYGVKVERSAKLPTERIANYEELLDAVQKGLPIPPELLIEASDLPNKDRILEYLKNMRMQQAQQTAIPAGAVK